MPDRAQLDHLLAKTCKVSRPPALAGGFDAGGCSRCDPAGAGITASAIEFAERGWPSSQYTMGCRSNQARRDEGGPDTSPRHPLGSGAPHENFAPDPRPTLPPAKSRCRRQVRGSATVDDLPAP